METLLRVAITAIAVYAGLCLLLYLLQERMIFFPRPLESSPQGPHVQAASVQRDAVTLRGWVVNEGSNGPLLIYFGGNAEEVSGLVGAFAKLDAVTVLMNYRGYGASDGKPAAADLIDDAAAVVEEMVAKFGLVGNGGEGPSASGGLASESTAGQPSPAKARPVILFGRSLGSGIAALAARASQVDGLILLSPYRSIADIAAHRFPIMPVRWLLSHNIDATLALGALPQRVLGLYAQRDRVVPTAESQALLGLLRPPPQVVEFQGEHGIPLETPTVWAAVTAFLESVGDENRTH